MKKQHLITKQKGVTLIELMVAMALGLILTTGGAFLYTQMKLKIELMQEIQLLQKKSRIALNILARVSTKPATYDKDGNFDECRDVQHAETGTTQDAGASDYSQSGVVLEDYGLLERNPDLPYGQISLPTKTVKTYNVLPNWERISYQRDRVWGGLYGQMPTWRDRDDLVLYSAPEAVKYTSCRQFKKRVETTSYFFGPFKNALLMYNFETPNNTKKDGDQVMEPGENEGDPPVAVGNVHSLISAMPLLENVTGFEVWVGLAGSPEGAKVTKYLTSKELATDADFANCWRVNRYMRSVKYRITAQTEDGRNTVSLTRVVAFMNADIRKPISPILISYDGQQACPNWTAVNVNN